jgi:dUTPase
MGFFDCKNQNSGIAQYDCDYYVSQYDKLVQICAPSLMPIYVTIVETENELGMKTARGDGGFGSTGS